MRTSPLLARNTSHCTALPRVSAHGAHCRHKRVLSLLTLISESGTLWIPVPSRSTLPIYLPLHIPLPSYPLLSPTPLPSLPLLPQYSPQCLPIIPFPSLSSASVRVSNSLLLRTYFFLCLCHTVWVPPSMLASRPAHRRRLPHTVFACYSYALMKSLTRVGGVSPQFPWVAPLAFYPELLGDKK